MKKPPRNDQVRDGLWIPQRTTETKGTTVSILPDPSVEGATAERERIRRDLERYVYAIEFSSGTVKVGQTADPRTRLAEHAKAAQAHGHTTRRSWVSVPHAAFKENEAALIAFATKRWPLAVGREAFAGADYDSILEYAMGLRYAPVPDAELAARVKRNSAIAAEWESGRRHRHATVEMKAIQEKIELIGPLVNDENRWASCDVFYELFKKAVALEPAPWRDEDPTAAERYLASRGASPDRARRAASEFELNFRTLFTLEFAREPISFEEIARFCDNVTAGPAQLDLGGAA